MKKILVTGGAGYIGSHTVVELHNAGYEPIILDNFSNSNENVIAAIKKIIEIDVQVYRVDCTDMDALRTVFEQEKDIAGIIHFAAFKAVGESVRDPYKYYHNNISSTLNLLKLMKELNIVNFVFSSSCTVYGQPEILPVDEKTPLVEAESPYGHTKQVCEDMIRFFAIAQKEMKSVLLRYFNPIGAHPSALIGELPLGKPENLVPFITQTAAGLRDQLTIFGNDYNTEDGTCIRDYIHVVDLAKAHVKALHFLEFTDVLPSPEVINLGMGRGYSVKELVDTFEKISGIELKYKYGPRRQGDVEKIYSASEKAKDLLDWTCDYNLEDMIQHSWDWQLKLKDS